MEFNIIVLQRKGSYLYSEKEVLWTKDDADLIEKAIEESCEQINPDDWK